MALKELRVDGGASRNQFLMQFQADISGVRTVRTQNAEATALGAAYLAGLAQGVWQDPAEIKRRKPIEAVYEPAMDPAVRAKNLAGWQAAVSRTLTRQ